MRELALIFFIVGIIADMLSRIRENQEELIYINRKFLYKKRG